MCGHRPILAAAAAHLFLGVHCDVQHPEPKLRQGWVPSNAPLGSIVFRLSLKQGGLDELFKIAGRVSDPDNSMYGQYLTQERIDDITAPPALALKTVMEWVSKARGCSASIAREVVTVTCERAAAETLLSTKCRLVENRDVEARVAQLAVRCSTFSLPDEVHEATQAVYGLHGLPLPPRPPRGLRGPGDRPAKVTPEVLASTYQVHGVTPSGSHSNRQAVAEFQGQTMSQKDLSAFFEQYVPSAKAGNDKVYKYMGDPGEGSDGTEAALDIQYIMGLTPGLLTEFWYFKNMDFCGDLKNWTQLILAQKEPPLVHSVSYGWQGKLDVLQGCVPSVIDDVDADFAKLAARGITILFASGDSGAGYTPPQTLCNPIPGAKPDVQFVGDLIYKESVRDPRICCAASGTHNGAGWAFIPGKPEACAAQTLMKDTEFNGDSRDAVHASGVEDCCSLALSKGKRMWSYDANTQLCIPYYDLSGVHQKKNVTSGYTPPGTCQVFAKITGSHPRPGAISSTPEVSKIKLYPSWPASSPWVTSVGSTRFVDQQPGQPEMATDQFGSGGGFSTMFPAYTAQKDAIAHFLKVAPELPPAAAWPRSGRGTPDVAGLGEGYQVMINGHVEAVGGTSASTPMFAGLVSLLNEARLGNKMPAMGYLNPWLYKNPAVFTDCTRGDNYRGRGLFVEPYGYNTTVGWDPVTGLGTPLFDKMLAAALHSGLLNASNAELVV